MLRGLDPLLSPDLLHILAAMGHGDRIVIADANFPGSAVARRICRLDGISATEALRAILSVLPLDSFVDDRAQVMQVVGDASARPIVFHEFQTLIDNLADHPAPLTPIERFAFYEVARSAFAVVQTGETRLYGNIILTKGVIGPPA